MADYSDFFPKVCFMSWSGLDFSIWFPEFCTLDISRSFLAKILDFYFLIEKKYPEETKSFIQSICQQ